MAKIRGIVAEAAGKGCILLTPEGEFVRINRVPRPVRVGQELEVNRSSYHWPIAGMAVAAALLLALVLPLYTLLPAFGKPAAYVSLDINPSLELGVNQEGLVVETRAYNQEAQKLLKDSPVNKTDVYHAVQLLIAQAVKDGYIAQAKENLIVAAYTADTKFRVDSAKLEGVVKQEAVAAKVPIQYLVTSASSQVHREAEGSQVSQGKYLVFESAKAQGQNISLDDLKKNGIIKTLQAKGVKVGDLEAGVNTIELNTEVIRPDTPADGNKGRNETQPKEQRPLPNEQGPLPKEQKGVPSKGKATSDPVKGKDQGTSMDKAEPKVPNPPEPESKAKENNLDDHQRE